MTKFYFGPSKSNKKVRFSNHIDVFPPPEDSHPEKRDNEEDNMVKGKQFTQEEDEKEYQKLFSLVNYDLQLKVSEEKRSRHGMLRDNICWTAVRDKLSSRFQANCCLNWYNQLVSPMVSEGLWADIDDFRLVSVLFNFDARCIEDVEWDHLLDHRCGDLCRKRWNQMVIHIGHYRNKSFGEQVEVLAQLYCRIYLK
ncbi:hypothetical protein BUALT_Bualt07G0031400 [Buddleja alternifolia]|uniref:Myb-like domain-containing protein n=1 Tax=Buddleja alternifolia TaxID=168488 RepID=A0AAV6X8P6_9LAMI|nr:hypothetical protein BUALT_Bualt07G0031400 [Buddleja alternifolia]